MSQGKLGFTLIDHNGEKTTINFNVGVVTAATLPDLLTKTGNMRTAIEGITLGTVNREGLLAFGTTLSSELPANDLAQVESAWMIVYEDVAEYLDPPTNVVPNPSYHKLYTATLGTADIAGNLLPNSDVANQEVTAIGNFVTAFESTVRSPNGGAVEIRDMYHVGRKR